MRSTLLVAIAAAALCSSAMAATLPEIEAFLTRVTRDLPNRFEERPMLFGNDVFTTSLPGDVLAYARFYWTVDIIEGVCSFLGQRTNIEMVDQGTQTRLVGPTMQETHPDRGEYMSVFDLFDSSVETIGEDALCSSMYKLLGPNGSLMSSAMAINGLLDPDDADRWQVRVEDGVLWSSRDYCQRRYYLEPPSNQTSHDAICKEAEEQPF